MHYLLTHLGTAWALTVIHLRLSLIPVAIGLAIAVPLGLLVQRAPLLRRLTTVSASVIFTIPSLALFVVLPLIIGTRILDEANVIVALSAYTTALMVRAVLEALDAVPAQLRDAAIAIGYGPLARMLKVELPLSIPVLVAGLRVVVVTNIAMVSVGSVIGIGGLGSWFTAGFQMNKSEQIVAGIIAMFTLAVVIDTLISVAGRLITPWERGRRIRSPIVGAPGELHRAGAVLPDHRGQLDRSGRPGGAHLRTPGIHRARRAGIGRRRHPARSGHRAHRPWPTVGGRRRQWPACAADTGRAAVGVLLYGLGLGPPIVALMLLGIPSVLAGTYAGIAGVDPLVVDAARAVGMSERQVLFRAEVPNALPLILGGLRSATLQVVATATVAAYASLGGLGRYLIDGIKERQFHIALVGALLVAVLALILDGLMAAAVWASAPGSGRLSRPDRGCDAVVGDKHAAVDQDVLR